MPSQPTGRTNQKRRTRSALVEAARRLLAEGRTPTLAAVADEALVSRATAYRYFPSHEHLLLEVVLQRSLDQIDAAVTSSSAADDPEVRVDGLARSVHAEVAANEAGFRSLLTLSLAQPASAEPSVAEIRGERRLHWIEAALAPLRPELDPNVHRRLAAGLALCVGAEGYFALRDLCGLEPGAIEETVAWVARALLAAAR